MLRYRPDDVGGAAGANNSRHTIQQNGVFMDCRNSARDFFLENSKMGDKEASHDPVFSYFRRI